MITTSNYLEEKRHLAEQILELNQTPADKWGEAEQKRWEDLNKQYDSNNSAYESLQEQRSAAAERDHRIQQLKEARNDLHRFTDRQVEQSSRPEVKHARNEVRWCLATQGWLVNRQKWLTTEQRESMHAFDLTDPTELEVRSRPFNLEEGYKAYETQAGVSERGMRAKWATEDRLSAEFRADVNWTTTDGSGTAGAGEFIPTGFQRELERAMLAFGGIRRVARIWQTSGFGPIHWPLADDTGNVGVLLAEQTTVGDSVAPDTNDVIFGTYKFSSKPVKYSAEVLQDSFTSVPTLLANMLAERIARGLAGYLVTGTGSAQPEGIMTNTDEGRETAVNTAISYTDMITFFHSINPAYRNNFSWVMHDSTLLELRKILDGQSRPLWQPGMELDEPDRIFGKPYVIDNSYPAFASGSAVKILTGGDHSKFVIRDHSVFRLHRLMELYRATDQEAVISFSRHESKYLNAGTAPIKHMATPA